MCACTCVYMCICDVHMPLGMSMSMMFPLKAILIILIYLTLESYVDSFVCRKSEDHSHRRMSEIGVCQNSPTTNYNFKAIITNYE